jgi:hypothetical protein
MYNLMGSLLSPKADPLLLSAIGELHAVAGIRGQRVSSVAATHPKRQIVAPDSYELQGIME